MVAQLKQIACTDAEKNSLRQVRWMDVRVGDILLNFADEVRTSNHSSQTTELVLSGIAMFIVLIQSLSSKTVI